MKNVITFRLTYCNHSLDINFFEDSALCCSYVEYPSTHIARPFTWDNPVLDTSFLNMGRPACYQG